MNQIGHPEDEASPDKLAEAHRDPVRCNGKEWHPAGAERKKQDRDRQTSADMSVQEGIDMHLGWQASECGHLQFRHT